MRRYRFVPICLTSFALTVAVLTPTVSRAADHSPAKVASPQPRS